jgi:hypothetical protein
MTVSFSGPGAGSGDLTWGQREILPILLRDGSSFSIGGWMPLPGGRTAAGVAADLRYLMGRHASLRTRLRRPPGGPPRQEVADRGQARLVVRDAGDGDPLAAARALHAELNEPAFDWDREWPIRWGVIVTGGQATHLVSVISHLAADGEGVRALLDDLTERDRPAPALSPLELARRQAGPAARRQNAAALAYWERLVREVPARRFDQSAECRSPRYWQVFYDSPATFLAVQVVAARTGASTSTVLLAGYALALAQATGRGPAVIQTVVSNRFRPGLAGLVSPLTNFGLCVIDVAGAGFAGVVGRAFQASMRAYKYAYCDPVQRAALIAAVSAERGEDIDLGCFVNDRRMDSRTEPGHDLPSAREIEAAREKSALTWGERTDDERERCYLHINNVPGTIQLELLGDTRCVTRPDQAALLRAIEAAIVDAALSS